MKDTIRRLGREGAAIVISSHLLHLLEELCSHVLIVKRGVKAAYGTVADIRAQFAQEGDANLEDVFIRIATADTPPVAVPPPPVAGP